MEAAAATSIKPAGDAAAEQQAAEPQPSGKAAAAANEVTPRWDVSNGDAWYKRQQVQPCAHVGAICKSKLCTAKNVCAQQQLMYALSATHACMLLTALFQHHAAKLHIVLVDIIG